MKITKMPISTTIITSLFAMLLLGVLGCTNDSVPSTKSWNKEQSWHANVGWQAENYFDDLKVVALCKAMEKEDMVAVDNLLVHGANVNAKGKGNMTPLLWAYFSGEDFFKKILEHGADPNVIFLENFGIDQINFSGSSIVHMAVKTSFPNYFKLVMEHGGDPNLPDSGTMNASPLHTAIREGQKNMALTNVILLFGKEANINYQDDIGMTPLMSSVKNNQFEVSLFLLESGANYNAINNYGEVVADHLAMKERIYAKAESPVGDAYRKVVIWLKDKGVEIEEWDDKKGAKRKVEREKQLNAEQVKQ